MLKALSRLWWRGVKKINKAQQTQNKKLVKQLLATPAPTKRKLVKSPAKKVPPASLRVQKKTADIQSQPLPGRWLPFYHLSIKEGTATRRRMQYWLYLPSVAASSPSPLPLVVMLHGCNQNVDDFVRGTRMNQLAETKGFAALYPQQSASAHLKRCWNWYNRDTQAGGGDARRIAAIINVVSDAYPIDKTRVYIAGLSAGATMASIVALNYPHLITAVGIHSGTVFGAGHSIIGAYGVMQRGSIKNFPAAINAIVQKYPLFPTMPAMLIHGLSDTVVRPVNAKQLTQQFIALNKVTDASQVAVTTKSASAANSSNPQNSYRMEEYYAGGKLVIKVCEITALGHAWSGGDGTVNYNACEGPDATHMLWEFFKRQQRIAVP